MKCRSDIILAHFRRKYSLIKNIGFTNEHIRDLVDFNIDIKLKLNNNGVIYRTIDDIQMDINDLEIFDANFIVRKIIIENILQ